MRALVSEAPYFTSNQKWNCLVHRNQSTGNHSHKNRHECGSVLQLELCWVVCCYWTYQQSTHHPKNRRRPPDSVSVGLFLSFVLQSEYELHQAGYRFLELQSIWRRRSAGFNVQMKVKMIINRNTSFRTTHSTRSTSSDPHSTLKPPPCNQSITTLTPPFGRCLSVRQLLCRYMPSVIDDSGSVRRDPCHWIRVKEVGSSNIRKVFQPSFVQQPAKSKLFVYEARTGRGSRICCR